MKRSAKAPATPQGHLAELMKESLALVSKARKHRKSLDGDNFYANKLSTLRSDAAVAVSQLPPSDKVDLAVLATQIDGVFSSSAAKQDRLASFRQVEHLLKTGWTGAKYEASTDSEPIFPLALLKPTRRGYLVTIAKQMNGCFSAEWYDACSVMMRRLVEAAIIEAFEGKGIAAQIKDGDGSYFQLTGLVSAALGETKAWTLSRNTKHQLPKLRDLGHLSAHGRTFTAQKSDVEKVQTGVRVVIEEFLRHAGLLPEQ